MIGVLACLFLASVPQGFPVDGGNVLEANRTLVRRVDGPKNDAGEFARFDVSIGLDRSDDPKPRIVWRSMCVNACQGPPPNHATHTQCNRLCDKPCTETHAYEQTPGVLFHFPVQEEPQGVVQSWRYEYGTLMQAAAARGVSWASFAPVLALVDRFQKEYDQRAVKFDRPHLVTPDDPCAHQEYLLYERHYDVMLTVTVTLMMAQGNAAPTETGKLYDRRKIRIGGAYMVDPLPTVGPREIDCACERTQHASTGFEPPKIWFGENFKVLPSQTRTANYASLTREGFAKSGRFSMVGENMNAVNVSFAGSDARALFLPAGTRLVPDDATAQELVVAENADLVLSTLGLTPISAAPKRLRVLCAEMKKHEPTPETRYAVAYPRDPELRRLAQIAASERNRGPWDQTRVWIYTDEASYDAIVDRLLPAVTKGTYVRMLKDVLDGSMPRAKAKRLADLLRPEFLAEPVPEQRAAEWAVRAAVSRDPQAVVRATRGRARDWLADPEVGRGYLEVVLWALIGSDSRDARLGAAQMLLDDVPEADRSAIARSAVLDLAVTRLFAEDEGETLQWLDVFERYGLDAARPWIELLARSGSGKAKARAVALLGGRRP